MPQVVLSYWVKTIDLGWRLIEQRIDDWTGDASTLPVPAGAKNVQIEAKEWRSPISVPADRS